MIKENDRTLIFNGLTEGDSVVVQQLINVSEGTMVQIANGKPGMKPQRPTGEARPEASGNKEETDKRKPRS